MADSKLRRPHVGQLFVTQWEAPWTSRQRKGQEPVTVWHRQTVLCKVTNVDTHTLSYEVLTVLEESGRPPKDARDADGGGLSLAAIRDGTCRLTPPTPDQLAMLPPSARGIGEAVAESGYRVPRAYAQRGLTLEHTGGGCTGLILEFSSGVHALVTAAEDAAAPTGEGEAVDVGVYSPSSGDQLDSRLCADADAALIYLDELSRKYAPEYLPDPKHLARDALSGAILHIRSSLGVPPGRELGAFPDEVEDREQICHLLTRFGQSVIYGLLQEQDEVPRS